MVYKQWVHQDHHFLNLSMPLELVQVWLFFQSLIQSFLFEVNQKNIPNHATIWSGTVSSSMWTTFIITHYWSEILFCIFKSNVQIFDLLKPIYDVIFIVFQLLVWRTQKFVTRKSKCMVRTHNLMFIVISHGCHG